MTKQLKWTIYCHIHRESGRRYIGLTKLTWRQRWNSHVYSAKRGSGRNFSYFAASIRKYGKNAFDHEVLEMCSSPEEANKRAQYWVWTYDTRNPLRGFNLAPGVNHVPHPIRNPWDRPEYRAKFVGRTMPEDQRIAISVRMTGHVKSTEVKEKISASLTGKTLNEKTRKKISEAHKGKVISPKTRDKISNSNTGRRHTEEAKVRMSAVQRAKAADPASKVKRSEASRGRILSPETRANLSRINTGKSLSEETKMKISATLKKRMVGVH